MTYIEFFDKDAVENVCTSLLNPPDRVILIGDSSKLLKAHAKRYHRVFAARGQNIEFVCRSVNRNRLCEIVQVLTEIVETEPECLFDLTGGEELFLVAMGMVFARYPEKNIRLHRFHIRNNVLSDCDQDGCANISCPVPSLTVEENIRIYGGDIVYDTMRRGGTRRWNMDEDFRQDLRAMWEICRRDVKEWNAQIGIYAAMEPFCCDDGRSLTVSAPVSQLLMRLNGTRLRLLRQSRITDQLLAAGLLTDYRADDELVHITYKNEQVKQCLTKAGQALEMTVLRAALEATEQDGAPAYTDAMTGVCIDWDGVIPSQSGPDTENEIDVLLMHGMVPVFISCKNGHVEMEELFKLGTVADRFGGKYAKKVLVATALTDNISTQHLLQRAEDMGIRVVTELASMEEPELLRTIRKLWQS